MKLATYLRENGISDADFGLAIDKHRSLVTRYRNGSVIPPLAVIARIQRATQGSVTAPDFFPPMAGDPGAAGTSDEVAA